MFHVNYGFAVYKKFAKEKSIMKKSMMCECLLALLLAVPIIGEAENLLKNYGFEKNSGNWIKPKYWDGTLEHVTDSNLAYKGKGLMKLTATAGKKGFSGKAYLKLPESNSAGRRYIFSMFVKGRGKLYASTLEKTINAKGKKISDYSCQKEPFVLSDSWQEIKWEIDLSQKALSDFSPVIELREKGEVLFDEMKLETQVEPGAGMEALSTLSIVPENTDAPAFTFKYSKPDTPVAFFYSAPEKTSEMLTARSDSAGKAVFPARPVKESSGEIVTISAAAGGAVAESYLEIIPQKEFDMFCGEAGKVKIKKPLHILFLGDSISDLERGRNYIDKTVFWLNLNNPGMVTFRNAAVRGDHILRMKTRFENRNTKKSVFRQKEYDNLFEKPYDLIFLFLGPNDTVSYVSDGFRKTQVPQDIQKQTYREVLSIIRRESKAPVVLLSALSLEYDICRRRAEKAVKQGNKKAYRFGEPAKLEAFNDVLKQLAQEEKLDFVDLYTPFKEAPKKSLLFKTDGVHLNNRGNSLMALCMLHYFQSKIW